jgi:hypothetical protein
MQKMNIGSGNPIRNLDKVELERVDDIDVLARLPAV